MTRLRVSSHRLEIEAGRWSRPIRVDINERKCSYCNVLEDEYHFVLECCNYAHLRILYIPRYFRVRPNMRKFVELLTSNRKKDIRNLAIYTYKAFKKRNELVFLSSL